MAKKKAVKKGSAEAKRRMAKVRSAKKTTRKVGRKKVTKTYTKERQTPVEWTNSGGYLYQYNKKKDGVRQALPPGQRMSKNGNVYYEYRANRTDISKGKPKGQMFGVEKNYDKNSHNYNFTISGTNFKNFIKYKGYVIDKIALTKGGYEYWVNSANGKYHYFNAKSLPQAKKFIDRTIYLLKKIK